jgi:flagellar hook-length control protein FliK
VKAAAPQAPGSTLHPAKTSSKSHAASARPAGAVAFEGVLAKALAAGTVSAKARVSPAALQRGLVREPAADTEKADRAAPRGKTTRGPTRSAARSQPAAEPPVLPEGARVPPAGLPPAAAASAETRSVASAPRSEPRIQVIDLRKKPAALEGPGAERAAPRSAAERAEGPVAAAKPFAERLAASGEPRKPAPAAPLERIREMTGSDLVRTVGLVVRDGGGEIRLTLKPESLGSVRIRLSLEDGKIEGRIVVDTPEARQVFEASIDSLTRALHADGFQTGSLQVSVSGGNANDSRQAAGLLGDTIRGARLRASDEALQASLPLAGWTGGGDGLVNVFA